MLTIKSEGLEITHGRLVGFLEKISKDNIEGFYPTGSVYFGLNNEKSDMDFIVKEETWKNINKEAYFFYGKNFNIIGDELGGWDNPEYEFKSIKFNYKNKIFNFIIVPDEIEYKIWIQTTNSFMLLLENRILRKIMKNKESGIEMFEIFKNIFRNYYERKGGK